ncbi:importin beta-like SAD2 [Tanacetum coccineum]
MHQVLVLPRHLLLEAAFGTCSNLAFRTASSPIRCVSSSHAFGRSNLAFGTPSTQPSELLNRVDHWVEPYIRLIVERLRTTERPYLKGLLVLVVDEGETLNKSSNSIADALYYNASLTLNILKKLGVATEVFNLWFQMLQQTKKTAVCAEDTKIIEQIDRDVKRTHPDMHFFSGDSASAKAKQGAILS